MDVAIVARTRHDGGGLVADVANRHISVMMAALLVLAHGVILMDGLVVRVVVVHRHGFCFVESSLVSGQLMVLRKVQVFRVHWAMISWLRRSILTSMIIWSIFLSQT